jgi:hypothetical protein
LRLYQNTAEAAFTDAQLTRSPDGGLGHRHALFEPAVEVRRQYWAQFRLHKQLGIVGPAGKVAQFRPQSLRRGTVATF